MDDVVGELGASDPGLGLVAVHAGPPGRRRRPRRRRGSWDRGDVADRRRRLGVPYENPGPPASRAPEASDVATRWVVLEALGDRAILPAVYVAAGSAGIRVEEL